MNPQAKRATTGWAAKFFGFVLFGAVGCSTAAPGAPGTESAGDTGSPTGSGSSSSGGGSSSGSNGTETPDASPVNGGSGSSGSGSGSSSGGGASSSSSSGAALPPGEVWGASKQLSGSVQIAAGDTVTIAPGATIAVAAGTTITVAGTLNASSATPTHAKLMGSGWKGVVVASGGTLALDGVDIAGASTALDVKSGATKAEYDDGNIDGATMPFNVEAGGALSTRGATVTGTKGGSQVSGSFTASHLDYNSATYPGITTMSPAATLSIEDSTLHGGGPIADFLVSSGGAAKFHVAYTNITNVHCAFHFDTITAFDISYTNAQKDAFGFMLYGSGAGGSVKYSNIDDKPGVAYATAGSNGPIAFDNCYVTGQTAGGTVVTTTNPQSTTVMGAGPRP